MPDVRLGKMTFSGHRGECNACCDHSVSFGTISTSNATAFSGRARGRRLSKPSRTNPEPTGDNNSGEKGITRREYPRRSLIIQKCFKPVCDERTRVRGCTCTCAECHFPCSKRADYAGPGLQYDDPNRCQVCNSKPRISHPQPIKKSADKNQCQTENDKCNK